MHPDMNTSIINLMQVGWYSFIFVDSVKKPAVKGACDMHNTHIIIKMNDDFVFTV
jgi:hypothetical protein